MVYALAVEDIQENTMMASQHEHTLENEAKLCNTTCQPGGSSCEAEQTQLWFSSLTFQWFHSNLENSLFKDNTDVQINV